MTGDLTLDLLDGFRARAFELVLVKREQASGASGVRVWPEPLVWVSGTHDFHSKDSPLPLVVSFETCVYRKRAAQALDKAP